MKENMNAKPSTLEQAHGIQVVSQGPEHSFVLDEDALGPLLLREDIRERAVVVVSVAGAFRKGKSFLLDFFLRYMHHKYDLALDGDWLGSEDEPLTGFSWRGGSERDTSGLLFWSQPYKAKLKDGEEVVILLVDTQGTFDSESTVRDNATIFALSTMISSVQIYNLSQNIEEDDLQHLQLFTEYGRLALERGSGKPFQRLQFLVRDWSVPYEYPYGAEGGYRLLKRRMEMHAGQHPELQSLRQHLKSCFEELACFLMPHPGLKVATNQDFDGKLSDISAEFKSCLKELVPMILAPKNLLPRRIDGHHIKAKDLLLYLRAYMKVFNGSELPEPKTILQATAEANNLSALAESKDIYNNTMQAVCGGKKAFVAAAMLEKEHVRSKEMALTAFRHRAKMGGKKLADRYEEVLVKEIEEQFVQLRAHNEAKNIFSFSVTIVVLLGAGIIGIMLGWIGAAVGLRPAIAAGQAVLVAAAIVLGVWVYSRATGNLRDMALQIDEWADWVRDFMVQQAMLAITYRRPAAISSGASDRKKQS